MRIPNSFLVIISQIEQLTDTVKRYTLIRENGEDLLAFSPGAHVLTTLESAGDVFLRRYSLCSPANEKGYYQIAIKRNVHSQGGSRAWHERVRVGQELMISAPVNHFTISSRARHHLFVAGGIGITPFVPMMQELALMGLSFELHYAARSPDQCPFYEWIKETYPKSVRFYFSERGERLSPEILSSKRVGTHVYFCGPQDMMRGFREAAQLLGYVRSSIHIEAFQKEKGENDQPFLVTLSRSRRELMVPAGQSLLDTMRNAGIDVQYSCQVGGCGACQLSVLSGDVQHRDFYLTEGEQKHNSSIIACVSRANGGVLVLDV